MLSSRRLSLLLAASLLGSVPAGTAHADDPLAGDSPFLPPASASSETTQTPDAALELRGVVSGGDGAMFSIFDPAHRSSTWTRLNDTTHPFIVRSYDPARDAVTVDFQGRLLTLVLRTAKVVPAPFTAPPTIVNTAMPPPAGAPQPIGGPVVLNPTPADEQRRLEAIAAEVNRRRMIRQQALQAQRQAAGQPPANPPGGPGAPPAPR